MAKSVSLDKGKSVDWYIEEKLSGWQQEAAAELHALILELVPGAGHGVKWGQAVYDSPEGPMLYMKGAKNHLTFGFWRGADLDDPSGVLEGDGDRMRHLKIKNTGAVDPELVGSYILQAVRLNAEKGDPTKRTAD